jgi:hypothetical protein
MAAEDSWASIQQHGLLSTSALLDLFEISGSRRDEIEGEHRPQNFVLDHPIHGTAVVRDQKPMSEKMLLHCLEDGITPGEWYLTLNRMVFFWPTEKRLLSLLAAYPDRRHLVLILDSRSVIERRREEIILSHINSGATRSVKHKRSLGTFKSISDHDTREEVAELAVRWRLQDIERHLIRREYRRVGEAPILVES